ncbi:uncharacterized protein PG998_004654 [Apiospora kogelbergensis]|uniref:Uncharacterized protein n=1 Tax=Apiospora kogelbergensis TaxID=1337665 RepID=A0AAW0QI34_9PEZI
MQLTTALTFFFAALAVAAPARTNANSGSVKPGTPVNDPSLPLKAGEFCSTTSQKGVLGCDDGTGNTFNIVNGQRRD